MKINLHLFTFILFSLFTTGCFYKNIEVYQDNDELLNCPKLTTKISDIIDINDEINSKTGLETTSLITWIIWPPAGGANQFNASSARSKLDNRFVRLMNLKLDNNCKITNKEIKFINNKGRFTDILKK